MQVPISMYYLGRWCIFLEFEAFLFYAVRKYEIKSVKKKHKKLNALVGFWLFVGLIQRDLAFSRFVDVCMNESLPNCVRNPFYNDLS